VVRDGNASLFEIASGGGFLPLIETGGRVRVCFTVDAPYAGGAERYVSLLGGGLDREVFAPMVLAKSNDGLAEWCGRLTGEGIPVVRAPMDMPFHAHHAIRVVSELRTLSPHIVHINAPGPYDGQMGMLAPIARAAGCFAVVVTEHLPRVERLWKRALVKRFSCPWIDRVLTVSRSNLAHLIERQGVPEHKIEAVYNGIPASYGSRRDAIRSAARRELGLEDGTTTFVFVGTLIDRKGVGVLIEAFAGLQGSPWRLFIIGGGVKRRAYETSVVERGLAGAVEFLGSIDESRVERILSAADCLVLPSFLEGMPYVILEAMACSLSVLATRVDGIPEAVPDGEAAILVPPGDADALRAAAARIAADRELRATLGANGRRRFERLFTLERHIERMTSLYLNLLGSADRRAARRE
jgi:glycosyltransferase involved in cell wall biosynthesis